MLSTVTNWRGNVAVCAFALAVSIGVTTNAVVTAREPNPGQTKVRPEVLEALSHQPQVSVIVSLTTSPSLLAPLDLTALHSDVAVKQESFLSQVTDSDFVLTHKYQVVPGLAGRVTASGIEKLAAHPDVASVGPNLEMHALLGQSVSQINADAVHALGITGKGVVVAVLDTGIDTDHPDLADDILSENCFLSDPMIGLCHNGQPTDSGPGSAEDTEGHGSHVSGIITSGGVVGPLGVAPDAGIRAYRVLNAVGGSAADLLAAADHIIVNYPDTDLVNLSLGQGLFAPGTCDGLIPAVDFVIDLARAAGATVFAASGNDEFKSGMIYPACISTVVSVGAVYDADIGAFGCDPTTAQDQVTCFSNSDSTLDLLAPGCSTESSVPGGGTDNFCGTSMASPHTVGTAALLLENNPALTSFQLEICLKTTGVPITDPANGITTPRIDALAALDCAPLPVGGLSLNLDVDGDRAPVEAIGSSGSNAGFIAGGITSAVAVGIFTMGSAAWYARRRLSRQ